MLSMHTHDELHMPSAERGAMRRAREASRRVYIWVSDLLALGVISTDTCVVGHWCANLGKRAVWLCIDEDEIDVVAEGLGCPVVIESWPADPSGKGDHDGEKADAEQPIRFGRPGVFGLLRAASISRGVEIMVADEDNAELLARQAWPLGRPAEAGHRLRCKVAAGGNGGARYEP